MRSMMRDEREKMCSEEIPTANETLALEQLGAAEGTRVTVRVWGCRPMEKMY